MEVRSLGERRQSSSKIGRLVGLVVASKRRGPDSVGRRLGEAPGMVRTSERWVVDTSGRDKASMLVGRLMETSGK